MISGLEGGGGTGSLSEFPQLMCNSPSIFHLCMANGGSVGKESDCHAGDPGSIPEWGRSPGGGNGNLLPYSCLEKSMDREPGGLQSMRSQRVGLDFVTKPPPMKLMISHKYGGSDTVMLVKP